MFTAEVTEDGETRLIFRFFSVPSVFSVVKSLLTAKTTLPQFGAKRNIGRHQVGLGTLPKLSA